MMLELSALSGGWGQTTIIEELSLSIGRGETVAILGRNGVGKSTLLELIVGRARLSQGRIMLDGVELSDLPTQQRARAGIGYVPQAREVFPSLSVRENIMVAARPGYWSEARLLDLFPSLGSRIGSLAGRLSGGEQQMLAIARALSGNPKLLLLDEPSEGLAPIVVQQLVAAMKQLARDGAFTIVLVEQRSGIAFDLAERCVVIERGRIQYDGLGRDLASDEDRLAALMGLEAR